MYTYYHYLRILTTTTNLVLDSPLPYLLPDLTTLSRFCLASLTYCITQLSFKVTTVAIVLLKLIIESDLILI
jgi:hypothetical protein